MTLGQLRDRVRELLDAGADPRGDVIVSVRRGDVMDGYVCEKIVTEAEAHGDELMTGVYVEAGEPLGLM